MLSVCCLSGGPPGRLSAILELLRPVADELVIAVDDRVDPALLGDVGQLADVLVRYPYDDPPERALAWLHSLCHGDWIFRIDDDEVPSVELLAALQSPDEGLTHVWVPRRWVWDGGWIAEDPWTPDWQLRLVRPQVARFPGRMHIPIQADGPHAYIEAALYHLDLLASDRASRAAKAQRYEHARPGLRLGGLPLNAAYYLPELRASVSVVALPEDDAALLEQVLAAPPARPGPATRVRHATRLEIDASWTDGPLADDDYRVRIALHKPPSPVVGEVRSIDVEVTNLGAAVWHGGERALPEIRLSYRWSGVERVEEQLRTALPHDVRPGETALVPVVFRAPDEPGAHELVVDLVHERRRWFGADARTLVIVRPRRRAVVLVGQPPGEIEFDRRVENLLDGMDTSLEPVLVGPKEDWLRDRFGTQAQAAPPGRPERVFVVAAGGRRQRLRLQRAARKLRRDHPPLGALRLAVRTTLSLASAALAGLGRGG